MQMEYFSEESMKNMKNRGADPRLLREIRKRKEEMRHLQIKLRSNKYNSVIDSIIRKIKNSCDDDFVKKYKVSMLEFTKEIRKRLKPDVRKYVDNFTMYPGWIFGCYGFPYKDECPGCKSDIILVWLGLESMKYSYNTGAKGNDDWTIFKCKSCKTKIVAEEHVWHYVNNSENEFLRTICQNCHKPQKYPYAFSWMPLEVFSGGTHAQVHKQWYPEWIFARQTVYTYDEDVGLVDTEIYTVVKDEALAKRVSKIFEQLDKR